MNLKAKGLMLSIVYTLLLNLSPAFSQKKAETIMSRWADKPVLADGLLNDWPDTLSLYNNDAGLYYSLSNDSQNIYLALRSASRESLTRILIRGISFSANIEKKKEAPTVTFPVPDRTPGRSRDTKAQPDMQEALQQLLEKVKDIRVQGFKEIIDGSISLENTYGIRAAAAFDHNNNLVQEIIIPLKLLNLSADTTGPVTYRIRVNGIQEPPGRMAPGQADPRQRMGGMYGRGMYGGNFPQRLPQNKLLSTKEFYIKSSLATQQ